MNAKDVVKEVIDGVEETCGLVAITHRANTEVSHKVTCRPLPHTPPLHITATTATEIPEILVRSGSTETRTKSIREAIAAALRVIDL